MTKDTLGALMFLDGCAEISPAEELAQWEALAKMDDCISNQRFCASDLRVMVYRLRQAEEALCEISELKTTEIPQDASARLSRAIEISKTALPDGLMRAADLERRGGKAIDAIPTQSGKPNSSIKE